MGRTDAADPKRIGIVGFGNAGHRDHAPAFAASAHYQLVAVADPIPALRNRAEDFGIPPERRFEGISEMLEAVTLDAVSICAPPSYHVELASVAADHGVDVFCEKPLAASIEDARQLVELAKRTNFVSVHNYLLLPEIRLLRSALDRHEIGRLQHIDMSLMGVVDYPGVHGFDPSWRYRAEISGGGVLMDMMHVVYMTQFLIGQIHSVSGSTRMRSSSEVEEFASCFLAGEHGTATINIGWGWGRGGISVTGELGRIDCSYVGNGTPPFAGLEEVVATTKSGRKVLFGPVERPGPIDVKHREFFDWVACNGPSDLCSAEAGYRALAVVKAVYESAAEGRTVVPQTLDLR